ncbi:hypothetical protein WFA24289_01174 [Periweissella fabaria]|uniref:ATPase AAA-type core domain-containing protein n=2 Tax=Periweissella fabaria TaxID=546157 RepID=A0ABM8Z6P6_9LACO|nr:hypothetical protein WFA24289_01174 [Periweissella fabaria]
MNSQVIKSIELNNEEFKKQTLYFSEYLNTIIGGRSSGKSILLSIIANLCRSVEEFKTDNKEYDQLVKDLSEGSIVTFAYGNIADGNSNIKFIFQDGLQKIARNKNDFNKFINQNFISKTDLKNLLVSIENKKQDIQNELLNKIRDIQLLDKKIIGFKSELSENQNISVIQENINQLENEINKAQENVSKLDKDKVTNLLSEEQNTHNVQKNIELGKQTLDVIINSDVVSISSNINGINNIYIQDIVEEINAYVANINAHISEVANEKKEKLEVLETENIKKISDIHSDNDYVEYFKVQQNFPEIRDKQTMLENQEKLYDHLEKILKAFDNEKIEKKSRIDEIINLFNVQDLKKQVVIYNEDELVVKYISDLKIEPLIDLCRDSFKTSTNVFRSLLPDLILSKFSEDKINADDDLKIEDLVTFVRNCLTKDISSALRSGKTLYDVLNKLASLDFITESYSVKYNNQFFNQMSEGKKSFVLLLMQLTISEDNSPLLIDQPEDELDNKAIYNELVRFIRNQKIRRQLFIVTHNPNVVVAGDSESITIAEQKIRSNGEYEFIYTQGTIEDSETQEKICLVLEGGKTAFLNRQKRYEFITEVRS